MTSQARPSVATNILANVSKQIEDLSNPILTGRYRLEGTIGKGHYSQVKRATDRLSGTEVAIKILRLPPESHQREKVRIAQVPNIVLT